MKRTSPRPAMMAVVLAAVVMTTTAPVVGASSTSRLGSRPRSGSTVATERSESVRSSNSEGSVGSSEVSLGKAERLLVFSVPTLTWGDLDEVKTPNLRRVLGTGAVADLSVRSVSRQTTAADGYATLNAGTRTKGTALSSLAFVAGRSRAGGTGTDGDPGTVPPGAFESEQPGDLPDAVLTAPDPDPVDPASVPPEAGETYEGTPAAEEFARRTGVMPGLGEVFNFGLVSMLNLNSQLLFGTEVGALGEALGSASVGRAVIANGDHGTSTSDDSFRREASVALMDHDGLVERGRVGRTLLESSQAAPFGTRYDLDEVENAFVNFFKPRSVVLVEASDMVRSEEAKALSTAEQQIRLRRQAIERSDDLLGKLLEHVDPAKDAVLIVAPYASGYSNGLTVVGVAAPSVKPGLLSSGTTRRAGFVQTVDIAPTITSLMGIPTPTSMEGTLMESFNSKGSFEKRVQFLQNSFSAAIFRDATVGVASTVFVLAQLVLWGLAVFSLFRPRRRLRLGVEIGALSILMYLPVTYLAGIFPFYRWGSAAYWAFVILASAVLGIAAYLPTRRYLVDPLITTLGVICALLSVDIVTGGALQFNTVFGYTPTVAGRFDGMGNPAFSMFSAAAIMLSALIAYRIGGRRGAWVGVCLLVWTVILDGAPIWGADVGGALALVVSAGITALMLLEIRIRARTAALLAVLSVVAVTGLGLVDLMRPPAKRTHLGRLLADIYNHGFGAFQTVILRKLDANLSVLTSSVWTLMLPLVFAFLAFVFWKAPWHLNAIRIRIPQERAAVAGLISAMVLGFALNDSGIAIPGIMLGVISASIVHLMLRVDSSAPEESQSLVDDVDDRSTSDGFAAGDASPLGTAQIPG